MEKLQRNFETGPIACLWMMQLCYPWPYNMAKEAVRALTRVAAREWGADKITVNNVLPLADTWDSNDIPPPTNALLRYGSPEEDVLPLCCSSRARMLSF